MDPTTPKTKKLGRHSSSKSRVIPLDIASRPSSNRHSDTRRKPKKSWSKDTENKVDDVEKARIPRNAISEDERIAYQEVEETEDRCIDCLSAYRFTCASIENFCRCLCPHQRQVPRLIYLVVFGIVVLTFLIVFVTGIVCQVRPTLSLMSRDHHRNSLILLVYFDFVQEQARALALDNEVLVPAPAPEPTTTTAFVPPDPFYRLTVEGGNYYSFAGISSPDCSLEVVEASSQLSSSGNFSAEATVDNDPSTCFQTPESNMDVYGPTYIVYACSARTRSFAVDTANRCGLGPVTSYTIEWGWESDGANGTWFDLDDMIVPGATTTTTTTTTATTVEYESTTPRFDQRANIRTFSGADCTRAGIWAVESMDMCYYEYSDGNFSKANGQTKSIEILSPNVWISTYETCFLYWDDDEDKFIASFSGVGCHNLPSDASVGAIEVVLSESQLCYGGFIQGRTILIVGIVVLLVLALVAACPLMYHAYFVTQWCVPKAKRRSFVFKD